MKYVCQTEKQSLKFFKVRWALDDALKSIHFKDKTSLVSNTALDKILSEAGVDTHSTWIPQDKQAELAAKEREKEDE